MKRTLTLMAVALAGVVVGGTWSGLFYFFPRTTISVTCVCASAWTIVGAMCKSASRADEMRMMPPHCEWPDFRR